MAKNVSDQILSFLTEINVERVFGLPGDTIDYLMDSFRRQDKIDFVVMRHEESAAFAACAQAKLTGQLGVCMACQGPGAIHLLNGLYDAALDRVPVLAITGQIDSALIGTGMPQEINQIALFDSFTVFNHEVRSAENLPYALQMACEAAIQKKGVAHLSIPADLMNLKAVNNITGKNIIRPTAKLIANAKDIDQAVQVLNQAKKPAILFGGGAFNTADLLMLLSNKIKAPLIHTTRSKDIVDNHFPALMGGIGLMGSKTGNRAIMGCDTLLVVGSSFAFREFYPDGIPIIQIEHHPERLGAHVPITHGILGDTETSLYAILNQIEEKTDSTFLDGLKEKYEKESNHKAKEAAESRGGQFVHPQYLVETVGKHAEDDAIFVIGCGSSTVWCNNFLKLNGKQRFLWTWNLASLGWSLPAAIGAQMAAPEKQVIAVVGDGDFQMLVGDLATISKYELPIIFIILNNSCYQFIELEEIAVGNPTFGTKLKNPDYAKLAEAHDIQGFTVKSTDELEGVIKMAYASKKAAVINVITDPNEFFDPPKITAGMAVNFLKSKIKSVGI